MTPDWSAVPLAAIHDWHLTAVIPLLAVPDSATLSRLHAGALSGERGTAQDWMAALEPWLAKVYRRAYADAETRSASYAMAYRYMTARGFPEPQAAERAGTHAELHTDAHAEAFAGVNARVNAAALAAAYASADPAAHAASHPYARANAYLRAAGAEVGPRLTDGLSRSLARLR